jgi:hypothetical protein
VVTAKDTVCDVGGTPTPVDAVPAASNVGGVLRKAAHSAVGSRAPLAVH